MASVPHISRLMACLGVAALAGTVAATGVGHAATSTQYRTLSPAELAAVIDDAGLAPQGITVSASYVQDLGLREGLLCYTADWKPVTIAPAHLVWRAIQSTELGGGVRIYQYPTQAVARAAMRAMASASCPDGADPKAPLTQVKRALPARAGSPGITLTSTLVDDGQFETHDSAYRQVGKVIIEATTLVTGKADSAAARSARPQLPGIVDAAVSRYRSRATMGS